MNKSTRKSSRYIIELQFTVNSTVAIQDDYVRNVLPRGNAERKRTHNARKLRQRMKVSTNEETLTSRLTFRLFACFYALSTILTSCRNGLHAIKFTKIDPPSIVKQESSTERRKPVRSPILSNTHDLGWNG